MRASDKEVAPQEVELPGTRPTDKGDTVDTKNSTAPAPHPSTDERPCICYDGLVFIGRLELTEEGEEVEVVEPVPCRRCS